VHKILAAAFVTVLLTSLAGAETASSIPHRTVPIQCGALAATEHQSQFAMEAWSAAKQGTPIDAFLAANKSTEVETALAKHFYLVGAKGAKSARVSDPKEAIVINTKIFDIAKQAREITLDALDVLNADIVDRCFDRKRNVLLGLAHARAWLDGQSIGDEDGPRSHVLRYSAFVDRNQIAPYISSLRLAGRETVLAELEFWRSVHGVCTRTQGRECHDEIVSFLISSGDRVFNSSSTELVCVPIVRAAGVDLALVVC
jgi:hypothetical protein